MSMCHELGMIENVFRSRKSSPRLEGKIHWRVRILGNASLDFLSYIKNKTFKDDNCPLLLRHMVQHIVVKK